TGLHLDPNSLSTKLRLSRSYRLSRGRAGCGARVVVARCRPQADMPASRSNAAMKMTAAVLYEQGSPRPYADSRPLRIETVDLEGPGEGEVLVKVAGAGLCHSDLSTIDNSRPRTLPTIPGHEGAGVVAEVGRGITDLKVGDHVVFIFVPSCGT